MESDAVEEYLERYPGDDIIDVLGTDVDISLNVPSISKQLNKMLTILTEAGKKHDKPIAPDRNRDWKAFPILYGGQGLCCLSLRNIPSVMYWFGVMRVKKSTHYYAPYPGQVSADDFVKFSRSPKILFVGDNFELYK